MAATSAQLRQVLILLQLAFSARSVTLGDIYFKYLEWHQKFLNKVYASPSVKIMRITSYLTLALCSVTTVELVALSAPQSSAAFLITKLIMAIECLMLPCMQLRMCFLTVAREHLLLYSKQLSLVQTQGVIYVRLMITLMAVPLRV